MSDYFYLPVVELMLPSIGIACLMFAALYAAAWLLFAAFIRVSDWVLR